MEHDSLVTLDQMGVWAEVATQIVGGYYVASAALGDEQLAERVAAAFNQRGMTAITNALPPRGASMAMRRAHQAALLHRDKAGGRVVRFAGDAALAPTIAVSDLLTGTPIDEVVALGGDIGPEDQIVVNGFARPTYSVGVLTLHVTPLADGRFRTFEIAHPHQCCGGLH